MKPLSKTENAWMASFLGKKGWLRAWKKMRDNHIRETEIWDCDCDACTRTQKRRVNGYG